jgi:thiamine biosynthesis lipoprotein
VGHKMQYDEFRAMNSDIVLAASGAEPSLLREGFQQARAFIQQSEQRFTRFTDTSELAELNRAAGGWFQASTDMFQVLQEAQTLARQTEGLFNPAILPALKQAGYDRSMDELRKSAPRSGTLQVIEMQDFRSIQLDSSTQSVYLPDEMQIDLGGIAKGWIAEQAAWQLSEFSDACAVSAGGDMFLIGLPEGGLRWEIGLENPLQPEQDLAVLSVTPGAVATSSITKRRWVHHGQAQHHLIDPRTGLPAQTEWLSVTVWAETAAEAEVYAKVLLIGGRQSADEFFDHLTSKAYLCVDKNGRVSGSSNYHEVFNV